MSSSGGAEKPRVGRFVTIEGGEGTGKSTLIRGLAGHLTARGVASMATREPGGTPGAEAVRSLVVTGAGDRWDPVAEAMLMSAARRDHVHRKILPALRRGDLVICDRFFDSTIAYQGAGRGVDAHLLRKLHEIAAENLQPDLTFILDLPVEEGLRRAAERPGALRAEERFESFDAAFHNRIRDAFLLIAGEQPDRCAVIDASAGQQDVLGQAKSRIDALLEGSDR